MFVVKYETSLGKVAFVSVFPFSGSRSAGVLHLTDMVDTGIIGLCWPAYNTKASSTAGKRSEYPSTPTVIETIL